MKEGEIERYSKKQEASKNGLNALEVFVCVQKKLYLILLQGETPRSFGGKPKLRGSHDWPFGPRKPFIIGYNGVKFDKKSHP